MTTPALVDVESLAIAWAQPILTGATLGTETPADLAGALEFLRIERVGGPVVGVRTDRATISADYFAATRLAAKAGARAFQSAVQYRAPGARVSLGDGSSGVFLSTACISGPAALPWGNPGVYRFGGIYQFTVQTFS